MLNALYLPHQITEMEDVWKNKVIDLLQTSLDKYPFSKPRKHKHRTITFSLDLQPKPISQKQEKAAQEQLFSVREGERLMEEVSEASVRLTLLHSSPHLGALRGRVGALRSSLSQLGEIFSLLMQCQEQVSSLFLSLPLSPSSPLSLTPLPPSISYSLSISVPQWQDLLDLFLPMTDDSRSQSGLEDLQEATAQFQDVTQSIHGDPRIFSLLGKSRGQKGHRELQGHFLRQTLNRILEKMVCVWQGCVSHPQCGYMCI